MSPPTRREKKSKSTLSPTRTRLPVWDSACVYLLSCGGRSSRYRHTRPQQMSPPDNGPNECDPACHFCVPNSRFSRPMSVQATLHPKSRSDPLTLACLACFRAFSSLSRSRDQSPAQPALWMATSERSSPLLPLLLNPTQPQTPKPTNTPPDRNAGIRRPYVTAGAAWIDGVHPRRTGAGKRTPQHHHPDFHHPTSHRSHRQA